MLLHLQCVSSVCNEACRCPFERIGPDCKTVAIPACRLDAVSDAAPECPHHGYLGSEEATQWSVACECVRQCEALYSYLVGAPHSAYAYTWTVDPYPKDVACPRLYLMTSCSCTHHNTSGSVLQQFVSGGFDLLSVARILN